MLARDMPFQVTNDAPQHLVLDMVGACQVVWRRIEEVCEKSAIFLMAHEWCARLVGAAKRPGLFSILLVGRSCHAC